MIDLRQSLGPLGAFWTRSHRSRIVPQSSDVFFSSVILSEKSCVKYDNLMNLSNDKPGASQAFYYLLQHEAKCLYKIQVLFFWASSKYGFLIFQSQE